MSRSSTEAELVGVHDVIPQVIWTRLFLIEQGIKVSESVVYQDFMSAMLLEKNGRQSSTKRTRHIKIRFFFVKDRIEAKEVKIKHCPTNTMIGDFFAKPLQGAQFRLLLGHIMNIDPTSDYWTGHRSVLEIGNGQMELDKKRTDGIGVDGSVNELDGDGEEKKGKDEGSDDHNWK